MSNKSKVKNQQDKLLYQSNTLIESSYKLTLLEQKLIRIVASNVSKGDDDFKECALTVKELHQLFGTKDQTLYRKIDEVTDKLMTRFIKVKNVKTNEFEKFNWVHRSSYKDGVLKIHIHEDMKAFYLELDKKFNYTNYKISNVLQLKSEYSIRIYELAKQYQNTKNKSREIGLEEFRHMLGLDSGEYPLFANLKQRVIKPAEKEINKKTDIQIEIESITEGRKVVGIRLCLLEQKEIIPIVENEPDNYEDPGKEDEIIEKALEQLRSYKIKITPATLKRKLKKYGEQIFEKAMDAIITSAENGVEISKPTAYFTKILDNIEKNSQSKVIEGMKPKSTKKLKTDNFEGRSEEVKNAYGAAIEAASANDFDVVDEIATQLNLDF